MFSIFLIGYSDECFILIISDKIQLNFPEKLGYSTSGRYILKISNVLYEIHRIEYNGYRVYRVQSADNKNHIIDPPYPAVMSVWYKGYGTSIIY